jgi:hypothetical protein
MAYERKSSMLGFFQPIITLAQNAAEVLKEQDIGAASADHGEYVCFRKCKVVRLAFAVTSEVAGGTSVAPRVVFTKRPTPLSSSSEAVAGTVIVPDATAVGKVVYKDITPVAFSVGDTMEISHVIGTGTPTGQGVPYFECEDFPEDPSNNSDMVESA